MRPSKDNPICDSSVQRGDGVGLKFMQFGPCRLVYRLYRSASLWCFRSGGHLGGESPTERGGVGAWSLGRLSPGGAVPGCRGD